MKPLPSQEDLRSFLDYDPETGELFWREHPREMFRDVRSWRCTNRRLVGKLAGHSMTSAGYKQINISNKGFLTHRIIWKWMTGEDPNIVDHINGCRSDNRWSNLRSTTPLGNARNSRLSRNSSTGVTGISQCKKSRYWDAHVGVNYKKVHLGRFNTREEAIASRQGALVVLGITEKV